jgi:hypothetical protein
MIRNRIRIRNHLKVGSGFEKNHFGSRTLVLVEAFSLDICVLHVTANHPQGTWSSLEPSNFLGHRYLLWYSLFKSES